MGMNLIWWGWNGIWGSENWEPNPNGSGNLMSCQNESNKVSIDVHWSQLVTQSKCTHCSMVALAVFWSNASLAHQIVFLDMISVFKPIVWDPGAVRNSQQRVMGVSIVMGVPSNGWFISWKIPLKWVSWGSSYFRKPPYSSPPRHSQGMSQATPSTSCFLEPHPSLLARLAAAHGVGRGSGAASGQMGALGHLFLGRGDVGRGRVSER